MYYVHVKKKKHDPIELYRTLSPIIPMGHERGDNNLTTEGSNK
jgi:hypothetical protein